MNQIYTRKETETIRKLYYDSIIFVVLSKTGLGILFGPRTFKVFSR